MTTLSRRLALTAVIAVTCPVILTESESSAASVPERRSAVPSELPSVDGQIAFSKHHRIRIINPDGTGLATLTTSGFDYAPTWSPDGTRIAYTHEDAVGVRDLWVMNADGSDQTRVTTTGHVSKGGAGWSPDGSQLAFGGPCVAPVPHSGLCQYARRKVVLDTISAVAPFGSLTTLAGDGDHDGVASESMRVFDRVSWSALGDDITFASDSYLATGCDDFILVYHPSDGSLDAPALLGCAGHFGSLANPTFSPDGQLLGYDAYIDASGDIQNVGVTVEAYPGPTQGDLFRDARFDTQLAYAPSQDRVALVRDLYHDRIVLANPDGTHRSRLTRGHRPSWQPTLAS